MISLGVVARFGVLLLLVIVTICEKCESSELFEKLKIIKSRNFDAGDFEQVEFVPQEINTSNAEGDTLLPIDLQNKGDQKEVARQRKRAILRNNPRVVRQAYQGQGYQPLYPHLPNNPWYPNTDGYGRYQPEPQHGNGTLEAWLFWRAVGDRRW
ncbi:uncharacterized protein LOC113232241 [Hyposmocoma kahamanoa]|uniref:uncharacterized protein LOC113232241 n=1 Tax=Hyposmocoma kahamanoa TaxID=1477025 RepID=UPI000E6D62B8|nr:uncharacterized protein LOC113232241 [Hyposmocoma kahamanoa]